MLHLQATAPTEVLSPGGSQPEQVECRQKGRLSPTGERPSSSHTRRGGTEREVKVSRDSSQQKGLGRGAAVRTPGSPSNLLTPAPAKPLCRAPNALAEKSLLINTEPFKSPRQEAKTGRSPGRAGAGPRRPGSRPAASAHAPHAASTRRRGPMPLLAGLSFPSSLTADVC